MAEIPSVGATGAESSFRMVPDADAVPMVVVELGFVRLTVKPSLASIVGSPCTLIEIICDVMPGANDSDPTGNTPPTKSDGDAGELLEPVTA